MRLYYIVASIASYIAEVVSEFTYEISARNWGNITVIIVLDALQQYQLFCGGVVRDIFLNVVSVADVDLEVD